MTKPKRRSLDFFRERVSHQTVLLPHQDGRWVNLASCLPRRDDGCFFAKSGSADAVRSDPSRWALWGQGVQLCAAMSQQLPVSAKL